jgi:hypothetical protein
VLTDFTFFYEKIKYKVLASPLKLLTVLIMKILPLTRFKLPITAILVTENAYRKPHVPEDACDKLIFAHFPSSLQPMRGRHYRTLTNHREGNFEDGFSKHFQNEQVISKKQIKS